MNNVVHSLPYVRSCTGSSNNNNDDDDVDDDDSAWRTADDDC